MFSTCLSVACCVRVCSFLYFLGIKIHKGSVNSNVFMQTTLADHKRQYFDLNVSQYKQPNECALLFSSEHDGNIDETSVGQVEHTLLNDNNRPYNSITS